MIGLRAWRWPVWPKHVAWYSYQTDKGVLTEWFYIKLYLSSSCMPVWCALRLLYPSWLLSYLRTHHRLGRLQSEADGMCEYGVPCLKDLLKLQHRTSLPEIPPDSERKGIGRWCIVDWISWDWKGIIQLKLKTGCEIHHIEIYEGHPGSIQPFWISRELVAWPWCNLAASQRRPYCTSVNSHSPVGLVSRQWNAVDWACVLCDHCIHKAPHFQRRF